MAILEDFRKHDCFEASKLRARGFFERKKGFRFSVSDGQKMYEVDGYTDETAPNNPLSVIYREKKSPGEIKALAIRKVKGIFCTRIEIGAVKKKKPRGRYPHTAGQNGR